MFQFEMGGNFFGRFNFPFVELAVMDREADRLRRNWSDVRPIRLVSVGTAGCVKGGGGIQTARKKHNGFQLVKPPDGPLESLEAFPPKTASPRGGTNGVSRSRKPEISRRHFCRREAPPLRA